MLIRFLKLLLLVIWAGSATADQFSVATQSALNARSGPGTGFRVVSKLVPGTEVTELSRQGDWSEIRLPSGAVAFVAHRFLTAVAGTRDLPANTPARMAQAFMLETGGHTSRVQEVFYLNATDEVLSISADNSLRIWDAKTGELRRTLHGLAGDDIGKLGAATLSGDQRTLLVAATVGGTRDRSTGQSADVKLIFIDVESGLQVESYNSPDGDVSSVALSNDGKKFAALSYSGKVNLWRRGSTKPFDTTTARQNEFGWVAFTSDDEALVVAQFRGHVFRWNLNSRKLDARTKTSEWISGFAVHPATGKVALGSFDGHVYQYDDRNLQLDFKSPNQQTARVRGLAYSADGSRLLATPGYPRRGTSGLARNFILDTATFDVVGSEWLLRGGQIVHNAALSRDGSIAVIGPGPAHELYVLNPKDDTQPVTLSGRGKPVMSVGFLPNDEGIAWGSVPNYKSPVDRGTLTNALQIPLGAEVAFTQPEVTTSFFRMLTKKATDEVKTDDGIVRVNWGIAQTHLEITRDRKLVSTVIVFDNEGSYPQQTYTLTPDGTQLISATTGTIHVHTIEGEKLATLDGHRGEINAFSVSSDGRFLLSGASDQTVKLWDLEARELLTTLFHTNEGDWVMWTPEGFFMASEDAGEAVGWLVGEVGKAGTRRSGAQLYQTLNRPDLVYEKLRGDPNGILRDAVAALDLETLLLVAPPTPRVTRIEGEALKPRIKTNKAVIDVSVEVTDEGAGIGKLEWRVNGVLQGIEFGRDLGVRDGKVSAQRSLFVAQGDNKIEVTAFAADGVVASIPAVVNVNSTTAVTGKPRLFVLSLGVNDYLDGRLALNYAVGDALSLARAFRTASGQLFEDVTTVTLTDEEVTRDGIASTFQTLSRQIRPEDVFVFYIAGHGLTLDGRYYFIPQDFKYDGDASVRQNAVGQEELQLWLSSITAQKAIMLYDTCESGSLTMEPSARGFEELSAIERLTQAVGRTIMTASTDTAPALEGYRNHGLFTYTLLEAFAQGDRDGDDQIEINELIGYVDERLPVLSREVFGQTQIPQYKSRGNTFSIGRPVALLSSEDIVIPKRATHVVIKSVDVFDTLDLTGKSSLSLPSGAQVRLMSTQGDSTQIARDGVMLGWVGTDALLRLQ